MPRQCKTEIAAARGQLSAEKRLKLFRQWIAASREAVLFNDFMRERRDASRKRVEDAKILTRIKAEFDLEESYL